jgi:hypothetical protein
MGRKAAVKKSIRIVRSFDCVDLRKITSQSYFLQDQIKQFHMQHLDAVLYTNQLLTRFRLILNLHSTGFLCIPEIDEMSHHSLYLKISETLSKLSGVSHVVVDIADIKEKIKERVARQEEKEQNNVVQLRAS